MTPDGLRKLALALPGAVESAHMNHPDFRVGGKVFASLGYPNDDCGMVKLTPEQQAELIEKQPGAFEPCKGVWGQRGAASVYLASVTKSVLQESLALAFQATAAPRRRK